jgi:cytochrome c oxidase subunit 5b
MFLQRSAVVAARRVAPRAIARRAFSTTIVRRDDKHTNPTPSVLDGFKKLDEIKTYDDLLPPGAKPGTVPTDAEQSTGLERLEILGKMQGVDVFDMKPLDSSRVGTMEDPIIVNSAGEEQYAGCTGFPADSHDVLWVTLTREEPKSRCMECGSVYEMKYVGPQDDGHGHGHDDHHPVNLYPKPKDMADFLKPEYLHR